MVDCFLGLGSNSGDRRNTLSAALSEIGRRWPLRSVSRTYETDPQLVTDQPAFLNLCCRVAVGDNEEAFLDALQNIEASHGRNRSQERVKGPRTLDIDILLFGEKVLETSRLTLPHPGLRERQFVLRPLLEIAPGLRDPRDGTPLQEATAALPGQGVYCYHNGVVYSPRTDP